MKFNVKEFDSNRVEREVRINDSLAVGFILSSKTHGVLGVYKDVLAKLTKQYVLESGKIIHNDFGWNDGCGIRISQGGDLKYNSSNYTSMVEYWFIGKEDITQALETLKKIKEDMQMVTVTVTAI